MAEPSFIKVYSSFESGDVDDGWQNYEHPGNNPNAMMRVTTRSRLGSYSNKVLLQTTDSPAQNGSTRAEFTYNNPNSQGVSNTSLRWYAWSWYMPSATYLPDSEEEVIAQWHDKSSSCSTSPSLAIETKSGRYRGVIRYAQANYCTSSNRKGPFFFDLGPIKYDQWLDVVVYYDPKTDSTGQVKVWFNRNPTPVWTYNGPCHYSGSLFPYYKIGIYKWGWDGTSPSDTTKREFFLDEMRVGDSGGNLQYFFDVLGGTPPTTTTTTSTTKPTTTSTTTKPTTTTTSSTTKINLPPTVKIRRESDTMIGYLGKTILTADVISDDPITTFLWEQMAGPPATINSPTTPTTSLLELPLGEYVFKLTVTDSKGVKASDSIILTVSTTFIIQGY